MTPRSRRSLRVLGALLLIVLSVSAKGTTPFDGCADRSTSPSIHLERTPDQVVRAVEWSWDNRSNAAYRDLFTADFVLACAATDSAGNSYRDTPWIREDELEFFHRLIDPNRSPPLRELTLDFDPGRLAVSDPRPGHEASEVHKLIEANFTLRYAEGSDPVTTLTGQLRFFVVRGDSAAIPPDLARTPDSRVWYIERWEDMSLSGGWCGFPGRTRFAAVPRV